MMHLALRATGHDPECKESEIRQHAKNNAQDIHSPGCRIFRASLEGMLPVRAAYQRSDHKSLVLHRVL